MKGVPRLLETGPPEVRDLLAVGLDDAPGKHLLPALRTALGASIVVGSAAAAGTAAGGAASSVSSMVASATTSGAFAKSTVTATVAAKTSVSLVVAKALASGLVLGSALCGGALLSGVGQGPTMVRRGTHSVLSAPSPERPASGRIRQDKLDGVAPEPLALLDAQGLRDASAPELSAQARGDAQGVTASAKSARARVHRSASSSKRPHEERADDATAAGETVAPEKQEETPSPEPSAKVDSPNLLALEIARVDEARALLNSGKPDAALAALNTYDPTSPGAVLGREALIIRIEALLARGDRKGARSLAAQYLARYPKDVHAGRMKEIANAVEKAP